MENWKLGGKDMTCEYCQQESHPTMESIEHCMNIRKGIVKANLVMHGVDTQGERMENWWN